MKDNEIIKTEDLIFDYTVFDENGDETGKNRILTDINLSIEKGSFVAVLGHNGSGKSTLAKHFNGILLPTSGKVLVDGIDTTDESRIYDIRQTVGMVFQNPDNQIVATIVDGCFISPPVRMLTTLFLPCGGDARRRDTGNPAGECF